MDATFREVAAEPRVESMALSHLSIELGHLYMEDFAEGHDRLDSQFARVAPWARTAREACAAQLGGRKPRVSTCFLIDDYFTKFSSPAEVLPTLLDAARHNGLEIDYLARESACAESEGVPLARLVAARLTALPVPGANGSRPPVLESGWLCNGERSPGNDDREAMNRTRWSPPTEIGARNHSVFVDVELWRDNEGSRLWSCAYLASVWQLLRLGLLRNDGASVVHPIAPTDGFPSEWHELPPILQLNPAAAPFSAYRTFSVLPSRFLQVEYAVRAVLDQFAPVAEVLDQITVRADRDGSPVSPDVPDRIDYVFYGSC